MVEHQIVLHQKLLQVVVVEQVLHGRFLRLQGLDNQHSSQLEVSYIQPVQDMKRKWLVVGKGHNLP